MRIASLPALVAAVLAAATPSLAQPANTGPEQPFVFPTVIGTSPAQVAPFNPTRRSIEFCNPNATATIAVCPVRSRADSTAITCAINGAGSVTIPPSWCWGKSVALQGSPLPTAWMGVASAGGSNITIFATE